MTPPPAPLPDVDPDLDTLLPALEAELHHPGRPCSAERLDALLHPGFHEVGRSGLPYDRATVVGYLTGHGGDPQVRAWGHAVHRLGADSALMTFCSARIGPDGSVGHAARRMSVWRRTALGWQLFYHQGTPMPGPVAAP